jgi:probable HAF family extracellular repeat protein
VVGYSHANGSQRRAFRWSLTDGMIDLGTLPGDNTGTTALAVSADGSVIVGRSADHAFRWTSTTGIVDLGTLPGLVRSDATGISADGSVVVGSSYATSTGRAFRWTLGGGMVDLGTLPGDYSYSYGNAVNADGSVVSRWQQRARLPLDQRDRHVGPERGGRLRRGI